MQIEQVGLLEHATLELIYVEIKVFGNIDQRFAERNVFRRCGRRRRIKLEMVENYKEINSRLDSDVIFICIELDFNEPLRCRLHSYLHNCGRFMQ